jgi:hypothetical protein
MTYRTLQIDLPEPLSVELRAERQRVIAQINDCEFGVPRWPTRLTNHCVHLSAKRAGQNGAEDNSDFWVPGHASSSGY